jgi:hypothetical protein
MRRRHLDFVRERIGPLVLIAVIAAIGVAVSAHTVPPRAGPYVIGAGAASVVWLLVLLVVQMSGAVSYALGAEGERWTVDALRPLRRRGWHVISHVPLEKGDLDHALIGPGGAYALETKATFGEWNIDDPDEWLLRAASQARHRAERLHFLLLSRDCNVRVDAHPLLVLWGPISGSARRVTGVEVVHGSELRAWSDGRLRDVLSDEEVRRASDGLQRFVERRDAHIRATEGAPPLLVELGPFGLASQVGTGILGALISWITVAITLDITERHGLVLILLGNLALGVTIRRYRPFRIFALGWLCAAAGFFGLLAVLYVISWLQ